MAAQCVLQPAFAHVLKAVASSLADVEDQRSLRATCKSVSAGLELVMDTIMLSHCNDGEGYPARAPAPKRAVLRLPRTREDTLALLQRVRAMAASGLLAAVQHLRVVGNTQVMLFPDTCPPRPLLHARGKPTLRDQLGLAAPRAATEPGAAGGGAGGRREAAVALQVALLRAVLEAAPGLQELALADASEHLVAHALAACGGLADLRGLHVTARRAAVNMRQLADTAPRLTSLHVYARAFADLPAVGALRRLTHLHLHADQGGVDARGIAAIGELRRLASLQLAGLSCGDQDDDLRTDQGGMDFFRKFGQSQQSGSHGHGHSVDVSCLGALPALRHVYLEARPAAASQCRLVGLRPQPGASVVLSGCTLVR